MKQHSSCQTNSRPLESVLSTKTNFHFLGSKSTKNHGTIMAEKEKDERMLMTP
ncbi:MAG: hypothetical protein ACLUD0_02875 [Eubacterium ramulus]